MKRAIPFLFAGAAALALVGAGTRHARRWHPDPAAFPVAGVTVADSDGGIEWPAVKAAGADFAYVRASHGGSRDRSFEANWSGAADAGLRRGAGHDFSLCHSAAAQARAFITTVPRTADALPSALALDFDPACTRRPDRAGVLGAVRAFLLAAERHDGRPFLLRISPAFEEHYRLSHAVLRPLWAERRFLQPDYLARPWRIWQASDIRRIDGVAGPIRWSVVAP